MMICRSVCAEDLPAIMQLFRDTVFRIAIRDYTPAQCEAWTSGAQDPLIWGQRFLTSWSIVLVENDTLLGFANLLQQPMLDCFYVSADHQSQGIGSRLLTVIEDHARQRGDTLLESNISITARPFFEKRGWQVVRENRIQRNDQLLINFRMRKPLK